MPHETPINSKKTGGFALFDSLVQNGTRYIFGYPGGAILPLYDELYFWEEQNLIKHIYKLKIPSFNPNKHKMV